MRVNEVHKDSTLHTHIMIYHSDNDTNEIHQIIRDVESRERELSQFKDLTWHIKLNNGKANASSYLFKYIVKEINHENDLKVEACRSFYSTRGFSFFGIENSIGKFNHLCSNYMSYEKVFSADLIEVFKTRSLHEFLTKHSKYFENYSFGKNFLGVIYRNNEKITLIEKKQYCLLEYNSVKKDDEFKDILLNIEFNKRNSNNSFESAKARCDYNENLINGFYEEQASKGFTVVLKNGKTFDNENYLDLCAEEENKGIEYFNDENTNTIISLQCLNENNRLDITLNTVILIQHYASKSDIESLFERIRQKPEDKIQS